MSFEELQNDYLSWIGSSQYFKYLKVKESANCISIFLSEKDKAKIIEFENLLTNQEDNATISHSLALRNLLHPLFNFATLDHKMTKMFLRGVYYSIKAKPNKENKRPFSFYLKEREHNILNALGGKYLIQYKKNIGISKIISFCLSLFDFNLFKQDDSYLAKYKKVLSVALTHNNTKFNKGNFKRGRPRGAISTRKREKDYYKND